MQNMTDKAALERLGQKIAACRLSKNMTQGTLAIEAGISTPTVQRIESGASTQVSNLIRILRALKLLDNLDVLVPETPISPLQQLEMRGKIRKRASSKDKKSKADRNWSWGDDV